jgi:transcriptional regulator with XRE-family HTH domain
MKVWGNAKSPLQRMLNVSGIRRIDLAARAGVTPETITKLCNLDPKVVATLRVESLQRVALAMGVAPAELIPWLLAEPRDGLMYERGAKIKKTSKAWKGTET